MEALESEARAQEPDENIIVKKTGCRGFCESGPIVVVGPEDIFYHGVAREDVPEIISETLLKGHTVERLLYEDATTGEKCVHEADIPFYKKQARVVLRHCGHIVPRGSSGSPPEMPRVRKNISFAMVMKGIPGPSWTVASWKAIPTACSKG